MRPFRTCKDFFCNAQMYAMALTRKGTKYVPQDTHYKVARKRGFVARSALKLEEIDKKFRLFKKGMRVLDMGCAPGSWIQYASPRVGPTGLIVGVDLDEVRVDFKNVQTFVGNLYELNETSPIIKDLFPFDLIQSDAMTKTTGIADTDCARSIALVEHSVMLAGRGLLRKGGSFVAKVFEGPGFTPFYVSFKPLFKKTSVVHPEATRSGSREVYVVGLDFK